MSDETLFQATVKRVSGAQADGFLPPMIVCGRAHRALVETQMKAIGVEPSLLVLEPCGRGTAPIAAIATRLAAEHWPDASLVAMAAAESRPPGPRRRASPWPEKVFHRHSH